MVYEKALGEALALNIMYLNFLHTHLGNQRAISEIPCLQKDEVLLNIFHQDGFKNYLRFEENIIEAIDKLLSGFLPKIGTLKAEIDAVLFVSDNSYLADVAFNEYNPFISFRNQLYNTLADHGVAIAFPYIIGGSGCANMAQATQLASGLMAQGACVNILVLLVDKFEDENKRIMPMVRTSRLAAGSIGSDVAAAFMLSKEPLSASYLEVKRQLSTVHLPMIKAYYQMVNQGSQASYMLETVKGLVKFRQKLQQVIGRSVSDFEKIYTGNYVRDYFKIYAQQFSLKPEQIDMYTKSAIGHAQSLDAALSIFSQEQSIDEGLVFLIGPCMWSALEFAFVQCDTEKVVQTDLLSISN